MSSGENRITNAHLSKMAIVYTRQSTLRQVHEHKESTGRQYNLAIKARKLGWRDERIVIIDEVQGLSGAFAKQRTGFQHLIGEVAMGNVGVVFALEVCRLGGLCVSSRLGGLDELSRIDGIDWLSTLGEPNRSSDLGELGMVCNDRYCLLGHCTHLTTLTTEEDGIYDPNSINDRFGLGLKGTMSEVELHIPKSKTYSGKLNKTREEGENHHYDGDQFGGEGTEQKKNFQTAYTIRNCTEEDMARNDTRTTKGNRRDIRTDPPGSYQNSGGL